jgi:tetratricopeptide (TPR) repeat protein
LDAVTYPQTAVSDAIAAHCVPLQIDNTQPGAETLLQKYRHIWTPDLRILEADGNELYRWGGYLPPFEFAPQFLAAVAQAHLRLKQFDPAIDIYEDVLKRFPTSFAAAEAHYFLAVSKYRKTHESNELLRGWHELEKTFPGSEWTVKQNF